MNKPEVLILFSDSSSISDSVTYQMVTWSMNDGPGRIHKKNITRPWPRVKVGNCWIQVRSTTIQADLLITNKDCQVIVNTSTVFSQIKDDFFHKLQFPGKFLYRICLKLFAWF